MVCQSGPGLADVPGLAYVSRVSRQVAWGLAGLGQAGWGDLVLLSIASHISSGLAGARFYGDSGDPRGSQPSHGRKPKEPCICFQASASTHHFRQSPEWDWKGSAS